MTFHAYCHICKWHKEVVSELWGWDLVRLHRGYTGHEVAGVVRGDEPL